MTAIWVWIVNYAVTHIPAVLQAINMVLTLILSYLFLPVYRKRKLIRQELARLEARLQLHYTEILGCGVINDTLVYEPLGVFDTEAFGARIPDIVYAWNDGPSDDLIDPVEPALRRQILAVLRMNVCRYLHQPQVITLLHRPKTYDTRGGRYHKMIVCLVRPDAPKLPTLDDSPRAVIIEEEALRRIHESPIAPDPDDPETGATLLATMKLIATKYFQGDSSLILTLRFRLPHQSAGESP